MSGRYDQAQRLKRVFKIDTETCEQCDGTVTTINGIMDPTLMSARGMPITGRSRLRLDKVSGSAAGCGDRRVGRFNDPNHT